MSITTPMAVRVIDIIIGLVLVLLGSWIIIDSSLAEAAIIVGFAAGLALIGVARVVKGAMTSELKRSTRAIQIVTGLGVLLLA
ncbi:MAG: hypothetical protein JSW05_02855, partial [Candidatus Thorarchaeota archaeon]